MPPRSTLLLLFAAVVALTALTACECDDATTVFPISKKDHDRILELYGSDGIPAGECQALCVSPAGQGGGGAAPHVRAFRECSLTTIEWDTPAVSCTGTLDCGG